MKRIIFFSVFVLLLVGITSQGMGQGFKITQPNAVGGSFVGTHFDGVDGMGPGLEMFLKYNISPRLFLSAGTGISTITDGTFKMENFRTTLLPTLEIRAGYGLTEGSQFLPFIYGGLHAFGYKIHEEKPFGSITSDTWYDAGALIGGGFRYGFNELWSFHAMGDYRYIFTATTPEGVAKPQHWTAKAGLTYALQPSGQPRREEIEYPIGEGEISLDDLFNQEIVSESDDLTEADALALLFQPEEEQPGMMDTYESFGAEEEAAPDISTIPDSELNLRMQEMSVEMDRRSRQISTLQNQVDANERAISQFSQGQVAGTSTTYTPSGDFKANYQQALQTFHNRQYQEAIRIFRSLMDSNPNHQLASNCQYWVGESYNAMKQYREALNAFNSVMNYGKSFKFDDALIMSGLCNMKLGDSVTARENFEQLVSRYPNSEYAPKAMRYLGRL